MNLNSHTAYPATGNDPVAPDERGYRWRVYHNGKSLYFTHLTAMLWSLSELAEELVAGDSVQITIQRLEV